MIAMYTMFESRKKKKTMTSGGIPPSSGISLLARSKQAALISSGGILNRAGMEVRTKKKRVYH